MLYTIFCSHNHTPWPAHIFRLLVLVLLLLRPVEGILLLCSRKSLLLLLLLVLLLRPLEGILLLLLWLLILWPCGVLCYSGNA